MNYANIIQELSKNRDVFKGLISGLTENEYLWKSNSETWCMLEIICHLYDEEREDFRARIKHIFETPTEPLPPIDPTGWVEEREYIRQDFDKTLNKFVEEREKSVKWLQAFTSPNWENAYSHPKFGSMTAKMFLSNWLAHDYLHIRQIQKIKFDYLKLISKENLNYAGEWN